MYINAQYFEEFLQAKEILWLGIDFSHAKFTRKDFNYTPEILRYYFNDWNMLIISDQKKYDIRLSFRKPIMAYDLSVISKLNKSIKPSTILRDNIGIQDLITEDQVCAYIASLHVPTSHRFGLFFLVESFDGSSKTGAVWVIIMDTIMKAPVLCEKFLKIPGGFGTKSYWGRVFYNLFYDIKNYAFYRWENMIKNNNVEEK